MANESYARPELLVSGDWLAAHLNDPDVKVIDVRGANQYGGAHISGARNLPVARLDDPTNPIRGMLVLAPRFSTLVGALGVSDTDHIVLCDEQGYRMTSRAYWAFDYFGHARLSVLEGGLAQWHAEGRPLTNEPTLAANPVEYTATPHPERVATKQDVLDKLSDPGTVLLDVRTPGEYTGQVAQAMRGGHIPGAVNVEYTEAMEPGDPPAQLRPAADLQEMYQTVGATPDK
ncbi:MAG: rhodanese-like domain-containing protein, partial [Chloroflexi bacterium]|nr:rhodanese-like domain-containing protein [Chloroflexota bacterium]